MDEDRSVYERNMMNYPVVGETLRYKAENGFIQREVNILNIIFKDLNRLKKNFILISKNVKKNLNIVFRILIINNIDPVIYFNENEEMLLSMTTPEKYENWRSMTKDKMRDFTREEIRGIQILFTKKGIRIHMHNERMRFTQV